jgi:secreted PhoX family phosphatase
MASLSFDTNEPSQVKGLNGYTVDPLVTIGDKIGDYVLPGIPDGIGAYALNDTTVRVFVNSELGNTAGYKYTLKNGLQLPGARISYIDIDKRTFQTTNAGLAFDTIINREGKEVKVATDLENAGIARFCSASLFEANQFGDGIGLVDRLFIAGEENLGGTNFALDIKTNTLYAVPFFGRAGFENVTEINTGSKDKVAFLIGDDGTSPLTLYVGDKNAKKDGSFLDRNGLAQGRMFVWVADDPTSFTDSIEASAKDFKGSNNSTKGKFVEIDYYNPFKKGTAVDGPDADTSIQNDLGYDAQGFATQAQQLKLAADVKAFLFARPEDVSTNPKDGTQAVFNTTGIEGDVNTFGTTYRIDIDFNALLGTTPAVDATRETTAPFLLPTGFTQTKVVDTAAIKADPDFATTFANWDMIALDPSNRYIFVPTEVGSGAGLFRYDTQTGDVVTALKGNLTGPGSTTPATWNPKNDYFASFDPATYTPYNTVLVGEEGSRGRLFEWTNPLAAPTVAPNVVWRSNIPSVAHEGVRFDSQGALYFIDESNTGSIYKFVPKTANDLSIGQTFVLKVNAYTGNASETWDSVGNAAATRTGAFTWTAVTDANGNKLTTANPFDYANFGGRVAADELKATPYGRPEDLEIVGDNLYLATTSENAVYRVDLKNNTINVFANRNTIDGVTGKPVGTDFVTPDNIASDAAGNIFILEDNEPIGGDIWKAADTNGDGVADSISRWASLTVPGSEPTGLIATNNPDEFIVSIQHPTSGNASIWKISAAEISAKIDILYDGNDADKKELGLRSPDNLDWAKDGKIYINEDRAVSATLFGGAAKTEASIFSLDPNAADPSKTLTRIAQVDRSAIPAGQTDSAPTDVGNWETSGILDVSNLFGAKPGEVLIFDVQAHSITGGSIITATNVDGDGNGTKTAAENLVEGGQISLLVAPNAKLVQSSSLVTGGTADDTIVTGTKGFDGLNDVVFTDGGNDLVDDSVGGTLSGLNRLYTGDGNDELFAGSGDRLFGEAGDDILDATAGKGGNRLYGGAGNDSLFAGTNDFLSGGDGDDKLFGGKGGNNLFGGAGADKFYLTAGGLPTSANTVGDFEVGIDKLLILGISGVTGFSNVTLTQQGADTLVKAGGKDLALLTGIQSSTLTASSFAFV